MPTRVVSRRTVTDQQHRPPELNEVAVSYRDGERLIKCFCGAEFRRSIVPHFRTAHEALWKRWTALFIDLRGRGYPLKRIMRTFKAGDGRLLFSWTVIERAIREAVESGSATYAPPPKRVITTWEPQGFQLEKTTLWSFPRRGDWAVHSGDYRGNWPPQIPRNLILRYTQPGDLVVDAFAGGGTTLIEAWLLKRRSIGLDVSKMAIQTCDARLNEMEQLAEDDHRASLDAGLRPLVVEADALRLAETLEQHGIDPGHVALACAHPPYLDSLTYTGSNGADLSGIHDPDRFLDKIRSFARQVLQTLAPSGVLAILIGDVPKGGSTIHLGRMTADAIVSEGFQLEHAVVKTQHRDRSSEFYYGRNAPSLLMAHEYLFILRPLPP